MHSLVAWLDQGNKYKVGIQVENILESVHHTDSPLTAGTSVLPKAAENANWIMP